MSLDADESLRIPIHEISHAVISVEKGFSLEKIEFEWPSPNPGRVYNLPPPEVDFLSDPIWAKRQVAVSTAGYLGERVFFNSNRQEMVRNDEKNCDCNYVDVYTIFVLRIHPEFQRLCDTEPEDAWHDMRTTHPELWLQYDAFIGDIEKEVTESLHSNKEKILRLAKRLKQEGRIDGPDFMSESFVFPHQE